MKIKDDNINIHITTTITPQGADGQYGALFMAFLSCAASVVKKIVAIHPEIEVMPPHAAADMARDYFLLIWEQAPIWQDDEAEE